MELSFFLLSLGVNVRKNSREWYSSLEFIIIGVAFRVY